MARHPSHILEMARKGAAHRYQELKAEMASLEKHFPHLGKSREEREPKGGQVSGAEVVPHPPRKRRKMSAAARKKISDAQKARWAKQKEKKG